MAWKNLLALILPSLKFLRQRREPRVVHLPTHLREEVLGLPGDIPPDFPKALSTISSVIDKTVIRWCLVGDMLLNYYMVPKVTIEIEICVHSEDLRRVQEAFPAEETFCFPYRPPKSIYNGHLAIHPRFKIRGMILRFFLVPHDHYGLDPLAFEDIIIHATEDGPLPMIPLPHYVRGLASLSIRSDIENLSFCVQIKFLIDGMDIDEEWCRIYLDGPSRDFVSKISSPLGKKMRMGSHPKYDGNLTTYIHDEEERKRVIILKGRVLEDRGQLSSIPLSSTA